MRIVRARLPWLDFEPDCSDRGEPAPGFQHPWRGIPWPGTDNEEYRRDGVSRCMQRCPNCGAGRVTRYVEPATPGKNIFGSWTVEGFLSRDALESLTSRPGGSKPEGERTQDAAPPKAPGKLL